MPKNFFQRLLFVIFVFINFSSVSGENKSYELLNTCHDVENKQLFVDPNSTVLVTLTVLPSELNCTIEFSSDSPKLQFDFAAINLPFENSELCIAFVEISDLTSGSGILACRDEDLPKNGSVVVTSPAEFKVVNNCSLNQCDRYDNRYSFKFTISENFEELEEISTTIEVENFTSTENCTSENVTLPSDFVDENEDYQTLQTLIIVLVVVILSALILIAFFCWFFRSSFCARAYTIKPEQNVNLESKMDLTVPEEEVKGYENQV